ncbi:MAG: threonine synthase [Roseivirga sp.]
MQYYSTNRKSPAVGFKEAVINSLPPDNGLYFPESIPMLSAEVLSDFGSLTLPQLGFEMMKPFVSDIPEADLLEILEDVLSFEIPLVQVADDIYSLELYHGPTYAFKDVGARFLARCLGYFSQASDQEVTILVATSGDTGGAVANGFYGVEGVKVVILYPSGKVSDLQEKQLTTLGGNISALEVDGDFDDCQALVKQAFLDKELNEKLSLTSANSINIARWMPQSIYYAWMLKQLPSEDLLIAVPSGNYGNITAAMLAKRMGFPLGRFLACSNANDVVPRYLQSSAYEPEPTIATYANAMDVSKPSNFPRMQELYDNSYKAITADVSGFSLSDEQILQTISDCRREDRYLLDPHGAIGYAGLKALCQPGQRGVFLETAHPIKFAPTMAGALGQELHVPSFAADLMNRSKVAQKIGKGYGEFREWLEGESI